MSEEKKPKPHPKWMQVLGLDVRKEERKAKDIIHEEETRLPHQAKMILLTYAAPMIVYTLFPDWSRQQAKVIYNGFAIEWQKIIATPSGLVLVEWIAFMVMGGYLFRFAIPLILNIRKKLFTPTLTMEEYNRQYELRQRAQQEELEDFLKGEQ